MEAQDYVNFFKQGDYTLFDEFYQLTHKKVYFTALAILKDKHTAEDITQDAYVAFLQSIASVSADKNAVSYLITIARNKSINHYNKSKRVVLGDDAMKNVPAAPADEAGPEEILNLLQDADSREIVTYHVIMGYKFNEIARLMQKPLGTVLWKYNKAMKSLREKVKVYE